MTKQNFLLPNKISMYFINSQKSVKMCPQMNMETFWWNLDKFFDTMQSATTTTPFYQLLTFRPKLQTFLPKTPTLFYTPTMASVSEFRTRVKPLSVLGTSSSSSSAVASDDGSVTLMEYMGKRGGIGVSDDLVILIDHIQYACKRIAALIASPFNYTIDMPTSGSDRDAPKPLDIISVCFSSLINFISLDDVFSFLIVLVCSVMFLHCVCVLVIGNYDKMGGWKYWEKLFFFFFPVK